MPVVLLENTVLRPCSQGDPYFSVRLLPKQISLNAVAHALYSDTSANE